MGRICSLLLVLLSLCLGQSQPTELLNSKEVEDIHVRLDPKAWTALQANYLENTYYRATFEWRGQRVSNVGIRSRGRGSRSAIKPALLIDFNRYVGSQRFQSLRALAFENLEQDPPMMREFLSMSMIRRAGLIAPRQVYIHLFVNDQDYGLHLAMENIDKSFLTRVFGDRNDADEGDLYEYSWMDPWDWNPRGLTDASYVREPFDPQTNERSARVGAIRDFVDALAVSEAHNIEENLASRIDVANWIRYLAAEVFLAETDGFCGDVGTNNFYVYRRYSDLRWQFIAWDRDATLFSYERDIWHNIAGNALARKLLDVPAYRSRFLEEIARLIQLAEADNHWFARLAEETFQRIEAFATADPVKRLSNSEFQESVESLRHFLRERPRQLRMMLEREGVSVAPPNPSTSVPN